MLYLAIDQKPYAFRMTPLEILFIFALKIPRMKEMYSHTKIKTKRRKKKG